MPTNKEKERPDSESHPAHGTPIQYQCVVRNSSDPANIKTLSKQASSREELVASLQSEGYLIISIQQATDRSSSNLLPRFLSYFTHDKKRLASKDLVGNKSEVKSDKKPSKRMSFFDHVGGTELIAFSIQLAALLKAGLPLLQSLKIVLRGTRNRFFSETLEEMINDVSQGFSLFHAVGRHPKVFPGVWAQLIEVGEVSGNLIEVLEEIARYQEAAARVKNKVISALFYPAILILLATGAVIFLLLSIIPKFEAVFQGLHLELPLVTKIVMLASKILREYSLMLVLVLAMGVTTLILVGRTKKGKVFLNSISLRIPVLGNMFLQVSIVRFCRGLSTLIHSGIPILNGLKIAAGLADNAFLYDIFTGIRDNVQAGHGLGVQLEKVKLFPVFMTSLITVGEESGELVRFLTLISNYYEERVDTFLNRLGSLLEPILLVLVGAVVGVIVTSVFLPLLDISTKGVT